MAFWKNTVRDGEHGQNKISETANEISMDALMQFGTKTGVIVQTDTHFPSFSVNKGIIK